MPPAVYRFARVIDNRSRDCAIYLCRRPLLELLAYHWSLYFKWDDYDATYEADDQDGYLIPKWNEGKPESPAGSTQMKIGNANISPQKVNEKARENKYSGRPYVLTMVNCQVWAKELAKMLHLTIPIPCNMVQVLHPPLGFALNVAHFLGLFSKNNGGSGDGANEVELLHN